MNDALNWDLDPEARDRIEYTTRIIRVYQHLAPGKVNYWRLDWERDVPDPAWSAERLRALTRLLHDGLHGRVDAVVIKDMGKGVISRDIITWLRDQATTARWYVSTKRWRPDWLAHLRGIDLQLLLVPQVSAREAIRKRELSCWLTRAGTPSREAMDIVERLRKTTGAKRILIAPERHSLLAYSSDEHTSDCVVQAGVPPEPSPVDMGGASILFPALVSLVEHQAATPMSLEGLVNLSLRVTDEWVRAEGARVLSPREWTADPATWTDTKGFLEMQALFRATEPNRRVSKPERFATTRRIQWNEEYQGWQQGFNGVGIVGRINGKGGQLQLWRAMVEVDGFVCCEEEPRKRIRGLLQGIHAFAKAPRHHAGCMLIASPGSGKTHLAKCLARDVGLHFVPFNITQLRSRSDIVECFESIGAAQAETDRRLLVFMDEINADLDGTPVYGAFLTPLEDGTYVHNGRVRGIQPCLWVFAGTTSPRDSGQENKGSDFVSRLTLGIVDLSRGQTGVGALQESTEREIKEKDKIAERHAHLRALENVYLGTAMLKAEFPDVKEVSEKVLHMFKDLPLEVRARDIKHFVRRFEDIQYGRVTSKNVPTGWPRDHGRARKTNRRGLEYSDLADITIVT